MRRRKCSADWCGTWRSPRTPEPQTRLSGRWKKRRRRNPPSPQSRHTKPSSRSPKRSARRSSARSPSRSPPGRRRPVRSARSRNRRSSGSPHQRQSGSRQHPQPGRRSSHRRPPHHPRRPARVTWNRHWPRAGSSGSAASPLPSAVSCSSNMPTTTISSHPPCRSSSASSRQQHSWGRARLSGGSRRTSPVPTTSQPHCRRLASSPPSAASMRPMHSMN